MAAKPLPDWVKVVAPQDEQGCVAWLRATAGSRWSSYLRPNDAQMLLDVIDAATALLNFHPRFNHPDAERQPWPAAVAEAYRAWLSKVNAESGELNYKLLMALRAAGAGITEMPDAAKITDLIKRYEARRRERDQEEHDG